MSLRFWWWWQRIVTIAVMILGLSFLFVPNLTFSIFNVLLFGSQDAGGLFSTETARYVMFVYRVLGAVLVGWAVVLYAIFYRVFIKQERWAWNTAVLSLLVWYLPDTYFSLSMGFPANAVLNTELGILLLIQLLAMYRGIGSAE
ncbi:MAG: hypothetical protein KC496_14325 [Anaerolineae bacterium]|nr:hypothetical protein [Anaerolineae bacterium]